MPCCLCNYGVTFDPKETAERQNTGVNMFGFGHWELLIVLVIAVIIFGAGKLPQVGSALGKSIGSFKKGVAGVDSEIKKAPGKIEAG